MVGLRSSVARRPSFRYAPLRPACSSSAEAHQSLGTLLAEAGRTEEAVAELRQAVELAPASAAPRVELGRALAGAGNPGEAAAELGKHPRGGHFTDAPIVTAFPGLHTHARALEAGVKLHGCTVHLVTQAMDEGPILGQAAVPARRRGVEIGEEAFAIGIGRAQLLAVEP